MDNVYNRSFLLRSRLHNMARRHIGTTVIFTSLLLFSNTVFAAASCPSQQRLYYIGATPPSSAYSTQSLSGWVSGNTSRTYTFSEASGDKNVTINFPLFLDQYTTYIEQPPYYGTLTGATLNAITMIHNSTPTKINHRLDVTINRPITRAGYIIQDIDSAKNADDAVPYQEAVNVASTGGKLTYNPAFHTINANLDMVTSILRIACDNNNSTYACPIEATWGAKAANSPLSLVHSNEFSQYNGPHVLGYSDFYFCLAPPKVTVNKQLSGTRFNDTSGNRDQFTISVNNGGTSLASFATTGSGSGVTNNSSGAVSLAENTSYTITERVTGSTNGDIANYNASYTCTNSSTGSATVMPTIAMTYNATAKTRSFTLSNVAYGDDISCTITNSPKSVFDGGSALTPASCPATHRMYYIGAAAPSSAYRSLPLSGWTAGATSREYAFTNGPTFTLNFTSILDLYTQYTQSSPFYGDIANASQNAINLIHDSTSNRTNHILNATVNRPVSKLGFVIQDVDSTDNGSQVPYREQVDVSGSAGVLTHNTTYHTINAANNIVTSVSGLNCNTVGACSINATWGYKAANSPFRLLHNNIFSQYDSPHAVAYSDFYFCMAPPKVVINKQLTGNRVNDTASNRDQFTISVNNGGTPLSSFETTGSGQNITNSSGAITLAENTTYTITERVTSSAMGDIANYSATYACTNSTSGSTTVMPTAAMTYNASNKTRSFTLSNVAYGDQITCTITNSPASYTFSGIVFNDNGGITASSATQYDTSATFTSNANYANGLFDSNENGIFASGLQVRLTDCSGNTLAASPSNPQTVSNTSSTLGRYNFNVSPSALSGKTKVCLVVVEPAGWDYVVDTTTDTREVTLVANTYNYSTAKDTSGAIIRNLDFGELKPQNAPLVLKKYQYVHQCDDALDYTAVPSGTEQPTTGFSVNPASDIEAGNCIAYKVEAHNRGHINITDVQITDELQLTPVKSVFRLPSPLGVPASIYQGSNTSAVIGSNGTIVSDIFNLSKATTSNPAQATLYFNSKYGATNDAP